MTLLVVLTLTGAPSVATHEFSNHRICEAMAADIIHHKDLAGDRLVAFCISEGGNKWNF